MSATLIALALFGCSDDGTACQRLRTPVETFATHTECSARLDDAVQSEEAMRAEYPTIHAECLTNRQLAALSKGTVDLSRMEASFAAAD
ncbi:MAG TPA: hypothetical protein VJQ77_11210 [Novosphingobium sp.]|nr:hypothetical protein [Novosphingobium sp.]